MPQTYTIKEVADFYKINPNAIRFYEKKGLIKPLRQNNGYRLYQEEDLFRLQSILLYRTMGFSIESIKETLQKEAHYGSLEIFAQHFERLNEHIHNLVAIRETLATCIDQLLESPKENAQSLALFKDTAEHLAASNQWQDRWAFDHWAETYDDDIKKPTKGLDFYRNYDAALEATAKMALGECIVDVGVGTGNLAIKCIEYCRNATLIGIDPSLNMLKIAKRKMPSLKLKLGDFLKLPVGDHTADTVMSAYAFHHLNPVEKDLAILEMKRILKPNGRLLITDLMFVDRKAYVKTCSKQALDDIEDEYFAEIFPLKTHLIQQGFKVQIVAIDDLIHLVVADLL